MVTALTIIDSARYDLIDEADTQYVDAMLLDYLNRGLRPLCTALAAIKSDWVNTSTNLTLALGASSAALPTLFVSEIRVTVGTQDLTKQSVTKLRERLRDNGTATGSPNYFAIQGTNMLFDKIAAAATTVILEYNASITELATTAASMPFNDEFNDILRQFIVLTAKARNKYDTVSDAGMYDFFYSALLAKTVSRNFIPSTYKTDF